MSDPVKSPSNYMKKDIEVITYIEDMLTPDEYIGFCGGNVIKYVSRWRNKGGIEDLRKANVYLGWMIEAVEKKIGISFNDLFEEGGESDG